VTHPSETLLRLRRRILAAWIALTVVAAVVLLQGFRIDNSVGVWFPKDDPAVAEYERYLEQFGESEWTLLMVEHTPGIGDELTRLTTTLAALKHVGRVLPLPGAAHDPRRTVLLLETDNLIERQDPYRIELVDNIHAAVEECAAITGHSLAGTSVINAELNRAATRDMIIFFSLATILIAVSAAVLFRSLKDTAVLLAVAGSTIVITMGLIVACGYSLNIITIMLPTVLIALSVADTIHVIHCFHTHRARGASHGVDQVVRRLWLPCLGTSVTTIVGFLSLSTSSVLPIFQLAIFASVGIAVAYTLSLTVAPLLLFLCWRNATGSARGLRVMTWPWRVRPAAVVAGLMLAATALYGLPRLEADTDYVAFFRRGAKVPEAYDRIKRAGLPQNPLVVVLRGAGLTEESVRICAAGLQALPEVKQVLPDALANDRARLVLMTDFLSSSELNALTKRIRAHEPAGARLVVTGTTVLWASMDTRVIETQVQSALIVSAAILIVLLLMFGSLRLAVLGWLVSVFPIALILGAMGLLGVTLDMATVLIAGIALGIAVDDTIHLVFAFRDETRAGNDAHTAADRALACVGPRLVLTSIILVGGFGALAVSDFVPTAHFGIFSSLTIVAALVMDLTVLPLALRLGRSGQPRGRPLSADPKPARSGPDTSQSAPDS